MSERILSEYKAKGYPIKIVFNEADLSLDIYAVEDKIHLPHWGVSWSIATQLMEHAPEMKKAEMVKKLVEAGGDPEEIERVLSGLDEFREGRRDVRITGEQVDRVADMLRVIAQRLGAQFAV